MAAAPGTVIDGRWRLEQRLGKGGMGEIWRAADTAGGGEVAIKLLAPALAGDPELVARFEREIRNSARIEHPNAVKVLGGGRDPERGLYLLMEVLRGRLLSAVAATEAPLAPLRVADIGRQIAGGLGAAHAVGVVHRDLKPENVSVSRDAQGRDVVRVFDFGLSLASSNDPRLSRLTAQDLRIGTPEYMSPEYITTGVVDARSDLYALGVVLYELASGRMPFEGPSYKLLNDHLRTEPPPLAERSSAPGWLCDAVHALLRKRPADRPASAAEVVRMLTPGPGTPAARG